MGTMPVSMNGKQKGDIPRKNVRLVTNIREITMDPNATIYKYNVNIQYFFHNQKPRMVSNSDRSGMLLEQDKIRCQIVVQRVFNEIDYYSQDQQSIIYDAQGCLYTFRPLLRTVCSYTLTEGISDDPNFKRIEFWLEKPEKFGVMKMKDIMRTVNQRDGQKKDNSILEAFMTIIDAKISPDVFLGPNGVAYLQNNEEIGMKTLTIKEGQLNAHAGIKTSVKTSIDNKVYASFDATFDFFYPENQSLLEVMKSFDGFSPNLNSNSEAGRRISEALNGVSFYLYFEKYSPFPGDERVMKIEGFTNNGVIQRNGKSLTVAQYFEEQYKHRLKYPNLMSIVTIGEHGMVLYYPPELVLVYSNQIVPEEKMRDQVKECLSNWCFTTQKYQYERTEEMFKTIFLDSEHSNLSIGPSLKIVGEVIRKPIIKEPTLIDASELILLEWNIAFVLGEGIEDFDDFLIEAFVNQEVTINRPKIVWIKDGDIERVFKKGKNENKQLMILVIDIRDFDLSQIRWWEHKYSIPCVAVNPTNVKRIVKGVENAEKIALDGIRRIRGITPVVYSDVFRENNQLVIGISISKPKHSYHPLAIGFSYNGMFDYRVFKSSFQFVDRKRFESGVAIADIVTKASREALAQRNVLPINILIYFDGISEDQYTLVTDNFGRCLQGVFLQYLKREDYADLIMIAATQNHNEKFYSIDDQTCYSKENIGYAEPGTVIDHTVVSAEYPEFYHFGPTKIATKYTVLFNAQPLDLKKIETITNDMCYTHGDEFLDQISVPAPMEMAKKEATDGSRILENDGPVYTNGRVDIDRTNQKFGCENL